MTLSFYIFGPPCFGSLSVNMLLVTIFPRPTTASHGHEQHPQTTSVEFPINTTVLLAIPLARAI